VAIISFFVWKRFIEPARNDDFDDLSDILDDIQDVYSRLDAHIVSRYTMERLQNKIEKND
jgi:hypothetical protein